MTEAVWLSKPHLANTLTPTRLLQQQMEEITTGLQLASNASSCTQLQLFGKSCVEKNTRNHTQK